MNILQIFSNSRIDNGTESQELKKVKDEDGSVFENNSNASSLKEENCIVEFFNATLDFLNDIGNSISSTITNIFNSIKKLLNLEAIEQYGVNKNGSIEDTKQGQEGDCWLLSGVNALNYTQKGKEILNSILEYTDNGTIVHLKGAKDYIISDKELSEARNSNRYSNGDDDMILIELAVEHFRDDVVNQELSFEEGAPISVNENKAVTDEFESSTKGGHSSELFYLVTGILSKKYHGEEISGVLDEFQNNQNKDLAITCTVYNERTVADIEGNEIKLAGPHAYSIKKVDDKNVTVINPWDTTKEIVLSRETFLTTFSSVEALDLSKESEPKKLITENIHETIKNKDGGYNEIIKNVDGQILKNETHDKKGNIILSQSYYYHQNGAVSTKKTTQYNDKGIAIEDEFSAYYDDGELYEKGNGKYFYDNDGKKIKYERTCFDPQGRISSEVIESYGDKKLYENKYYSYEDDNTKRIYRTLMENGSISKEIREYYDENDRITSVSIQEGNKYCFEEYYPSGVMSRSHETLKDATETVIEDITKEFYPSGSLKRIIHKEIDEGVNFGYRSENYDENGFLNNIEFTNNNYDNETPRLITEYYDKNERVIKIRYQYKIYDEKTDSIYLKDEWDYNLDGEIDNVEEFRNG